MKTSLLTTSVVCVLAWSLGLSFAGEDTQKDDPRKPSVVESKDPAPVKSDAPKTNAKDTPDSADPYKVPTSTDPKALMAFCEHLISLRPKTHGDRYTEYQQKMRPATKLACERILAIEKSESTENGRYAIRLLLALAIQELIKAEDGQVLVYLERVKAFVAERAPIKEDVWLIRSVAGFLEHNHPEKLKDFYAAVVPEMKKSSAADVVAYATSLQGTIRRLNLPDNEMTLKSETVDGKPFDVLALKGKVVLVYYWASWNQYSVKEIPILKGMYESYHKKGFEIVGISADQSRDALDTFLKDEQIPWTTLYENEGRSEAMTFYGVNTIPTGILIGKDGKVLSITAREVELANLLVKEFGLPDNIPLEEIKKAAAQAPVVEETKK